MKAGQPLEMHITVIPPAKTTLPLGFLTPLISPHALGAVSRVCSCLYYLEELFLQPQWKVQAEVEKPSMGMSSSDWWNTCSFSCHSGDHPSTGLSITSLPSIVVLPQDLGDAQCVGPFLLPPGNALSGFLASPEFTGHKVLGMMSCLWNILKTFTANCTC